MSSTSLDSREPQAVSPQELLARLERYAAAQRVRQPPPETSTVDAVQMVAVQVPVVQAPVSDTLVAPPRAPRLPSVRPPWGHRPARTQTRAKTEGEHRFNPSTIDLFPYDLSASIVGCAATIMAYIWFGRPIAIAFTIGLAAIGEGARRLRWFPSAGVNLLIGTLAGVIFVLMA